MEDSDDEVFWGPVTQRELKVIVHQLFPATESENTEIGSNGEAGSELHQSRPVNMENLLDTNNEVAENGELSLRVEDSSGNLNHSVSEIINSCTSDPKQHAFPKCDSDLESVRDSGSFNRNLQEGTFNLIESDNSEFSQSCKIEKINVHSCTDTTCISTFSSLENDCTVKTEFSDSTGIFSDSYNSMQSKFSSLSLDYLESQFPEVANANCIAGRMHNSVTSESDKTKPIYSSFHNCYKACSSISSNFSSEKDFVTIPNKREVRISNSLNNSGVSFQNDYLYHSTSYIPKFTGNNVSESANNMLITAEDQDLCPSKNSKSEIPKLQKLFCSMSGKNFNNSPEDYCGNGCSQNNSNSLTCTSMTPNDYIMDSDNLVTVIPDCVSTSLFGSPVHLSSDRAQVMKLNSSVHLENSIHTQSNQPSCNIDGYTSSESDSTYDKIEAETDSVLCSTLDSSTSKENSPNNTLEECEMMMKLGYEYMCSAKTCAPMQDLVRESKNKKDDGFKIPKSKYEPVSQTRREVLEPCQYIRASFEEINPQVLQKEQKENVHGAVYKTPGKLLPQKPISASCPRPLGRLKKMANFSDIKSPIAAYIKNRPVQLIQNAGKVHPGRKNIPARTVGQNAVLPKLVHASLLPNVKYEQARGFNVKQPESVELHGSSKQIHGTPTLIRHAGRAVLKAVPESALEMKNVEMSILFGKDVSQTMTLE